MKKLNVHYMYLEITRRCTLECAHCLRGNRQNFDISDEILDNALRDVVHIQTLDLGGGEPFLVPQVIESIINKIKIYGIKVNQIRFTTNGTVLTPTIIDILKKLHDVATLDIRISHDKFHLLEICKKKLEVDVNNNIAILTELLGYNPIDKYFVMDDGNIYEIGKAKTLTQYDLDLINKWIKPTYYHLSLGGPNTLDVVKIYDWDKDIVEVSGDVVISATGYLTQMDREYDIEDKGPIFGIHIKDKSLLEALTQYENEYKEALGEDEYQDYREEIDSKFKR